jgi:hypothetical protein
MQESNHNANLFRFFDMPDKQPVTSGGNLRNGLDHFVESPDPEDCASLDPLLGYVSAHRESRSALQSYRLRHNLFPPTETPQSATHRIVPTCGRARRTYQLSYIGLKQESCVQVFSHIFIPTDMLSNRLTGMFPSEWPGDSMVK